MSGLFEDLKPSGIWKHFEQILKIPHCSENETSLGDYVIRVAELNNLKWKRDDTGNVVVAKDATPGYENSVGVILQGHLDMVCEKNSDIDFDFTRDPIQAEVRKDWVQAKGTTLGSDNGIGLSAALAIMEDKELQHPAMEFLFTVEEETGLIGAAQIQPGFLSGKRLLNLDSEEEGEFTIGCAGGADSEISLPLQRTQIQNGSLCRIKLFGLRGGHSGIDINQGRGNAIKLLARMLWQANMALPFNLISFEGGNLRNAIPREAWADLCVDPEQYEALSALFKEAYDKIYFEVKAIEDGAKFSFEKLDEDKPEPLHPASQKALISLLLSIPHGVIAMHPEIKDLVETSSNLAACSTGETNAEIICSSRSSTASAIEATRGAIAAACSLAGAQITQPEGYPGWTPNLQSSLLQIMKDVFTNKFHKEPKIGAIHAGLECGIIGEKFPGMDMISFGPTIEHPHSPEERVHLGSTELFWEFLITVLAELK